MSGYCFKHGPDALDALAAHDGGYCDEGCSYCDPPPKKKPKRGETPTRAAERELTEEAQRLGLYGDGK